MTDKELGFIERKIIDNGLLQFRKYDSYVRESLQNKKIIFGAAKNFNDPWDCNLPIEISNSEKEIFEFLKQANDEGNYRKSLSDLKNLSSYYYINRDELARELRDEINRNRRFTCFNIYSEKQVFGNSLFWANYADKHFGICMKFKGEIIETMNSFYCEEGEFISPLPVEYSKEIPEFNYIKNRLGFNKKSSIQHFFGIKSMEWIDECEVRFIYENYTDQLEDYLQVRFDTSLLEKIYLGCNFQEFDIKQIKKILSLEEYQHVKISRMVKSPKSFRLIEQIIQ